jgi:aspartate aminotransferase-like enzyme
MESAIANLVRPGQPVLACAAGKFGERWIELGEAYGADLVRYEPGWGARLDPAEIDRLLSGRPDVKVAFATLSETSTGVVHDVEAIAAVARDHDVLLVVDAVSGLAAADLQQDAWGVDVVVAGSQKALMTPPGLSVVTVSSDAWERSESATLPRFYFDWKSTRDSLATGSTPFTPAVTLVAALDVALGMLLESGLDDAFARHKALGRACREGVKAMGLELFSPDEERSAIVTAILTPDGVDARELVFALRERFGITVAGGHGELGSRMFRIGHIGYYDVLDITTVLTAVEALLVERGADVERGAAVARALEAYGETTRV